MTASPSTNLQPGQPIDLAVTVTNYGPDSLPVLVVSSSYFVDEFRAISNDLDECYLSLLVIDLSDGTAEYEIDWWLAGLGFLPPFSVGSATCHLQIALTPSAPSSYSLSFGLPPGFETDSNPSNDVATVTLHRAPPPPAASVPALSAWMLLLLAGMSTGVAMHALRRTRRSVAGSL